MPTRTAIATFLVSNPTTLSDGRLHVAAAPSLGDRSTGEAMINAKTCPYPGAFAQRFGLGDARAAQLTDVAARLRGRMRHRLGEVVRGAHQLRNPPLRTGKQGGSPGGIGDGRDRPQFAGRVGGRRLDAVEQAGHIANRSAERIGYGQRSATTPDGFVEVAAKSGHRAACAWSLGRHSESCSLDHRGNRTFGCSHHDQDQDNHGTEQHRKNSENSEQPLHRSRVRRSADPLMGIRDIAAR